MNQKHREELPQLQWSTSSKDERLYGAVTPVAIRAGVYDNAGGEAVLARIRALLLAHAVGEGLGNLARSISGKITRLTAARGLLGATIQFKRRKTNERNAR